MLLIVDTITWKPHTETAIEIALCERDAGRQVQFCQFRQGLPICEDHSAWHHLIDLPGTRIRRAGALLRAERIPFEQRAWTRAERTRALARATQMLAGCADIEAVKSLRHEAFDDLGWSMLSSTGSMLRDSNLSLPRHRGILRKLCAAALMVYDATLAAIDAYRPDEVLLFNGRFATTRAAIAGARQRGLPWRMHERGGDMQRYWTAPFMPQDQDRVQQCMREQWRDSQAPAAHAFFRDRRNRVERAWHAYTHGQLPGKLPTEMRADGTRWASFFTSSEDEMYAIAERFRDPRYPTQMDALQALSAAIAATPGWRLCVRVHPHLAHKHPRERRKWAQPGLLPGALILQPQDPVDSYALMERSDLVCTYGSTIGVEATYWRRPSLLFGRAFYDALGVCTQAGDVAAIRACLEQPALHPIDGTLRYGAFFDSLGERYRYYQAEGLHRGSICGVFLDDTWLVRSARWIRDRLRR